METFVRQPLRNTGIIREYIYTDASNNMITVSFDTSEAEEIINVQVRKSNDYGIMVSTIFYFIINNVYKRVAENQLSFIPGTTVGTKSDLKNMNHATIINGTVVFYRNRISGGKKV